MKPGQTHLEETELIRGPRWADDQGFDVTDVGFLACYREGWKIYLSSPSLKIKKNKAKT
jgi:hypothetical protein